jgi:hypothetical protein
MQMVFYIKRRFNGEINRRCQRERITATLTGRESLQTRLKLVLKCHPEFSPKRHLTKNDTAILNS